MGVEIDAVWIRGDDGDVVGIAIFGTDGTRNDGGLVRTSPDDGNPGVGTARVAVDGSRGEDSGTGFTACSPFISSRPLKRSSWSGRRIIRRAASS